MTKAGVRRKGGVGMCAFVIDDEYLHGEQARNALEDEGWAVLGVSCDPDDGVAKLKALVVDLVVLDIRFGNESRGFGLAESIRINAACRKIPGPFIFFLTGHGDEVTRLKAEEFRGSLYVEKPVADLAHEFEKVPRLIDVWRIEQRADQVNRERVALVDKKHRGVGLTREEEDSLAQLQTEHRRLLESISTLDVSQAEMTLKELRSIRTRHD